MARGRAYHDEDAHDDFYLDDEHEPHDEHRARGMLGLWSAALFNICALILPLAGAYATVLVVRERLYTYEATPSAGRASRAALERMAAQAIPNSGDRTILWDDHVANALRAADVHAARGAMLLAPALLRRGVGGGGDAGVESAALRELTPGTRARYEATVPLLANMSAEARPPSPADRFPLIADARSFEVAAQALIAPPSGGPADSALLNLVLIGLARGEGGMLSPEAQAGISVLQAALGANGVSGPLRARLDARAALILPAGEFVTEARARAASGLPAASAMQQAFRIVLSREQLAPIERLMRALGGTAEGAGAQGALTLLAHAQNEEDVDRLQLLARTNPERAVALARILPRNGALPTAGRGALALTPELGLTLAISAFALIGMALAAAGTAMEALMGALRRTWRPDDDHGAGGAFFAR